jgi:multisubunit Na+/H+ antiporter MnhC subunit
MIEAFANLIFFGLVTFMLGVYFLLGFRNLLHIVLSVEVVSKGITLILLAAGVLRQAVPLAQSLIVTFIIVETILVAIMLAIVVICQRTNASLDLRSLSRLRG